MEYSVLVRTSLPCEESPEEDQIVSLLKSWEYLERLHKHGQKKRRRSWSENVDDAPFFPRDAEDGVEIQDVLRTADNHDGVVVRAFCEPRLPVAGRADDLDSGREEGVGIGFR